MNQESFSQVRSLVSAEEAAICYGLEVKRGWALCPFHNDHHPSLHFHDGRYHCFACSASGSCIDLTARLLGVDAAGAVRRLNADFGLNLALDVVPVRQQSLRQRHEAFERWRQQTLLDLNACIRIANRADMENLSDGEILAIGWREGMMLWADALMGTPQEQMSIYRERKEVAALTSEILKPTTRS